MAHATLRAVAATCAGTALALAGGPALAQEGITPPDAVVQFEPVEPGSGEGLTIGFTQLGLGVPFTEALQSGMEAAAETAGVELITCDSKFDAAEALNCARQFRTREVDGLVTFQADAAAAQNICAEGPQVPVIAIDIEQQPCQTSFVGAANAYAGEIVGYELGQYFQENFDCEHDAWVSLESLAVGIVNDQRMDGIRTGFEQVCGPVKGERIIDTGAGGQADTAQRQMTDTLTALPGAERIIVVGINEDVVTGALAAARSQGRTDDLYLGVQNFDPGNCQIWTAPGFVAAAAYFPERYAELIFPAIIAAANGEEIAPQILVPHEAITPENMAEIYPGMSC
ncbi:sugar ABC transporter substrate-binding protein [Wenxinia saemankumensis]|uniref:Monosaccharide ABC transporter substrate-binding protein, CUT2 family n=1 Tax=Wenxinia saemankumensis TaxID=1447782 RepID=A0A1M6B518_9RHOB|nr:sugar ABC transporter substrate-binding protein [Wenxinia saemankumensis]SHI43842.1 monosaccharide ABC transporter substrate-binding protein, CUT2 family [Wenxinia saemankumensis]